MNKTKLIGIDSKVYLSLLNRDKDSYVCFASKVDSFSQLGSVKVSELGKRLTTIEQNNRINLYCTVNGFKTDRSRTKQNLRTLNALFVDLDVGRKGGIGVAATPAKEMHRRIDGLVAAGKLPPFNVITYSGRGLYLFWVLSKPLPANPQNLTRYAAAQRALAHAMRDCGVDHTALDAARVLRLPGTIHSGAACRSRAFQTAAPFCDFDFYEGYLRPHLVQLSAKVTNNASVKITGPVRTKCQRAVAGKVALMQYRADDLEKIEQAFPFGIPQGARRMFLFLFLMFAKRAGWRRAIVEEKAEGMARRCGYPLSGTESVEELLKLSDADKDDYWYSDRVLCAVLVLELRALARLNLKTIGRVLFRENGIEVFHTAPRARRKTRRVIFVREHRNLSGRRIAALARKARLKLSPAQANRLKKQLPKKPASMRGWLWLF